ncbi:MAG TPA: hypothetical protein VFZ16_04735, partial [Hyphomicrobiaceae bacterium]|nr:hypothetical protein [Hyphomicrobiaceae bacterium]
SHISAPMPAITLWQRVAVKPVRAVLCTSLLAALHLLGGCMSTFGLQSDGTYRLESRETDATCDELYKSIWGRIELIKKLPAKAMAEQASPPATAFSMFGRWFGGSSKGLKAVEEYDREIAHAYALERAMRERKCVAVDLEREIADAASSIARIRQN